MSRKEDRRVERDRKRQVEDEWIDGKREWPQTDAKLRRVEGEARNMRGELNMNCNVKHAQEFPGPLAPNLDHLRRN